MQVRLEHQVKEHPLEVGGAGLECANDFSLVQHADSVGHPCHFVQMVAGYKDRGTPVFTGVPEQPAKYDHAAGVQGVGGFVQDEDIRCVDQGGGEADPLPVPQGQ